MYSPGVNAPLAPRRLARFGAFEFDLTNLKLFRKGQDLGLQQQPAQLLAVLVNRAGAVVTRNELREVIWPTGTYVEFDFGLNTTVNRLRRVLRDSAAEPRYIETIPKQGYRFIAPVELVLPIALASPELVEVPRTLREEPDSEPVPVPPVPPRFGPRFMTPRMVSGILAISIGVVIAVLFFLAHQRGSPPASHPILIRSYIALPPGDVPEVVIISPVGDEIVYQVQHGRVRQLYRRSLGEEEAHLIPGSDGATQPFFSPDGKEIGFYTPSAIRVAGPQGTRDLVNVAPEFDLRKAIWGEDGFVYYTTLTEGIWRVPASGGQPLPVLKPMALPGGAPFYFPQQILSSVRSLLVSSNNGPRRRSIFTADLAVGHTAGPLIERGMGGQVVRSGHLIYFWGGKLFAAPFDLRSGKCVGAAVEVLSNVGDNGWRGSNASISNNGTLVYIERRLPIKKLLWVDGKGRETQLNVPPADYEQAEVSPDGTRVALVRRDLPDLWSAWVFEMRSGAWTRILDLDLPYPRLVWGPDSKQLVVSMTEGDEQFVNLYRISLLAPGNAQRLTEEPDEGQFPGAWSRLANTILFTEGVHPGTQSDIYALALSTHAKRALVVTSGADKTPAFSPDGRWFAFTTHSKSDSQVFVQSLDQHLPANQVSRDGGSDPAWSPDGTRLYFLDSSRALMEVGWRDGQLRGVPVRLSDREFAQPLDWWTRAYSIAPDGRFLVIRQADGGVRSAPRIRVITNWLDEVSRFAPSGTRN